jgi:hypothetical protein
VSFASADPKVATVSGGTVTILGLGTTTLTATQEGDADYAAATPVTRTLVVAGSPVPPEVTLSALPDGAVTTDLVANLKGLAHSLNILKEAAVNGEKVAIQADGSFSGAVRLREGANPVTVVVTDALGLSTTLTRVWTLDLGAPTLTLSAPDDNLVTPAMDLTLKGTVDSKSSGLTLDPVSALTLVLNGGAPRPLSLADGAFQTTVTLVPGINTLEVTAATPAGRKAMQKRTVQSSQGLSLSITDPAADTLLRQGSYLVKGKVANATGAATVTLTIGGQTFTPAVVDGTFQQLVTFSAPGFWQVTVTGQDDTQVPISTDRNFVREDAAAPSAAYTLADALQALRISQGLAAATPEELRKYDLAPMVSGVSVGDGAVDLMDAMLVLRLALGLSL